jgi:hypothetical protein
MVAKGYYVSSGREHRLCHVWRQAETVRCILGVDHDKLGAKALAQTGEFLTKRIAPRPSNYVAQEQNAHS